MRIVALVPAYNEEETIAKAVSSLLNQTREIDLIVVVANNCHDGTAEIAEEIALSRAANMNVLNLHDLSHGKSEALNVAWTRLAQDADLVMTVDADSEMPPHALATWEAEFRADPMLGGSSPQVVMVGDSILSRMQRSEFTKSATFGLKRGKVSVISGTGACYRNAALHEIASRDDQPGGPWTYDSIVEDYYLTYRLRQAHWKAEVSPGVWCSTGSMQTLKALWHQRIKWQAGTTSDLIDWGINRLTIRDWFLQCLNFVMFAYWIFWVAIIARAALATGVTFTWHWLIIPGVFAFTEYLHYRKIRGRDWVDLLLAVTLIPSLAFSLMNMGWVFTSWRKVMTGEVDNKQKLWAAQALAEGIASVEEAEALVMREEEAADAA